MIKEKAIQKGVKQKSEIELLNDKHLIDMIFLPGFSTKNEVNHISGRGVGMDAVREVERLEAALKLNLFSTREPHLESICPS